MPPAASPEEEDLADGSSQGMCQCISACETTLNRLMTKQCDCVATTEFVLAAFTVAFTLEVIVVALIKPDGVPLPEVQTFDAAHPQWVFGAAALAIVLLLLSLEATNTIYQLSVTKDVSWLAMAGSFTFTGLIYIGTGIALHFATGSWIVLAGFICGPFALVGGSAAYTTWLFRGYSACDPPSERRCRNLVIDADKAQLALAGDALAEPAEAGVERAERQAEMRDSPEDLAERWGGSVGPRLWEGATCGAKLGRLPRAWGSGDGRRMSYPHAFIRGLATNSDYLFVAELILIVASDAVFGALVAQHTGLPGWEVAGALATIFFGLCGFTGYSFTRQWNVSTIICLVFAFACHIASHVSYYWRIQEAGSSVALSEDTSGWELAVWLSTVFWPALVSFLVGCWRLYLDNFTLHTVAIVSFGIAQLLLVGVGFVLVLSSSSSMRGAVALGLAMVDLLVVALVATVIMYARNGFRSSLCTQLSGALIIIIVAGAGVGVGVLSSTSDTSYAYEGFSVSWACLLLGLYFGSNGLLPAHAQETMVAYVHTGAGLQVMPGWMLNEDGASLSVCTAALLMKTCAFIGAFLWAILATVFLKVATYGLGCMVSVQFCIVLAYFELQYNSGPRFGAVLVNLSRHTSPGELMRVVDGSRRQARELQLLEARRRQADHTKDGQVEVAMDEGEEEIGRTATVDDKVHLMATGALGLSWTAHLQARDALRTRVDEFMAGGSMYKAFQLMCCWWCSEQGLDEAATLAEMAEDPVTVQGRLELLELQAYEGLLDEAWLQETMFRVHFYMLAELEASALLAQAAETEAASKPAALQAKNVVAVGGGGCAIVRWEPPNKTKSKLPITLYLVRTHVRRSVMPGESVPDQSVSSNLLQLEVRGLSNGSQYAFSVVAVTPRMKGDESLLSNTVQPMAPMTPEAMKEVAAKLDALLVTAASSRKRAEGGLTALQAAVAEEEASAALSAQARTDWRGAATAGDLEQLQKLAGANQPGRRCQGTEQLNRVICGCCSREN